VSAGRDIASLTDHTATAKYEALLEPTGWRLLKNLFDQMGLEADEDFCRHAMEACAIDRLRKEREKLKFRGMARVSGADFFRKGKADSWADDLSRRDVEVIEYIAGDLMRECGYAPSTEVATRRHKPRRLKRREFLNSLEWRTSRMATAAFDNVRRLV
jgi:hypothetical protein